MRLYSRMVAALKGLREYLYWASLFLILAFVFLAIILIPALLTVVGPQAVPYALHSILFANYSADPFDVKHSRLQMEVIAQVVNDQQLFPSSNNSGGNPGLNLGLETPVPSVTPLTGSGTTPAPASGFPTPTKRPTDIKPGSTASGRDPSPTVPPVETPTPALKSTPAPPAVVALAPRVGIKEHQG